MVKRTGFLAFACAALACCLVFSGCITVIEGTVRVKKNTSSVESHKEPAQKAPPPQRVQPAGKGRPAPQKAPPKTRHESQNIVLKLGQTYVVSGQDNPSAGIRSECWTSDSQVLRQEGQSSGKGGVKYIFKAVVGGNAVITYKKYQDGYLVLVREIRVTVPHAAKSGAVGSKKAAQSLN